MNTSSRLSADDVDWQPLTVTVRDALDLVGIGRTYLYELIAAGRVTTVKVGRRRLVHLASLKLLVSRGVSPPPPPPTVQLSLFEGGDGVERKVSDRRKRSRKSTSTRHQ